MDTAFLKDDHVLLAAENRNPAFIYHSKTKNGKEWKVGEFHNCHYNKTKRKLESTNHLENENPSSKHSIAAFSAG